MDRTAASDVHDTRLCHAACACRLQRSQDGRSVRVQPGRHWHRRHPAAEHQCRHAECRRAVHDQADGDPGCRAHHARSRAWIQDQRRARGRQQEQVAVSLPRSRPRPQPLPSAETTDILPVRRAYPSRHPTMANSHAQRVTDKDYSDDLSDTDESSSESQACGSDPNCQRSPTSSLTYKSKRPVLVAFKAPGMASAWTTAQLILIPGLDIVLLKRTRLHVSKTGDERSSRRYAQVFFSGPQLFLRDIRQLRMVADGRDERVVNVFARDQLVLSVKFDDVAGAVDFRSLCELTPVEKNSGTARGIHGGRWAHRSTMQPVVDEQPDRPARWRVSASVIHTKQHAAGARGYHWIERDAERCPACRRSAGDPSQQCHQPP
ncbi:hypothetical protein BC831DRAFT_102403 [Entophlyctis helioformis]|nr:hypothetical protein BC831DRAFT_102403 [Entophlyctis helioformis]